MTPEPDAAHARLGIVSLQVDGPVDGWRALPAHFAALEAAGAESIWLTDHLFWRSPAPDALSTLAVLALATEQATVGTAVAQVPLRHPASIAKAAAMAEAMAPGRVVLGLGVGEHEGEYQAAGLAELYHRRGKAADAAIDQIRRSWAADGEYRIAPGGAVPIWVGGRSDAARRRAAHVADGWIPHLCRLDWFQAQQALLDADLAAAGRPSDAIQRAAIVAVSVDGLDAPGAGADWLGRLYGLDPAIAERVIVQGPPESVAAELVRFTEAGADDVALVVTSDEPQGQFRALRAAFDELTR